MSTDRSVQTLERSMEIPAARVDSLGRRLCEGVQRKSRLPCNNPAMVSRQSPYCRIHGGKGFPSGPANPRFTTGRFSKVLGGTMSLAESYERAISDPELLSLRHHVAIWDARIEELLGRLGPNAAPAWLEAQQLYRAWQELVGVEGMQAAALEARQRFERVLLDGASAENTWNKLLQIGDAVRKLREAEIKREAAIGTTFTIANAQAFSAAMAMLAKEFVPPERLTEFVAALRLATLNAVDTRRERVDER